MTSPLRWRAVVLIAAALLLLAVAAHFLFEAVRRPTGEFSLRKVTFGDLAGWNSSDERAALAAFGRSCMRLSSLPPGERLEGRGYGGTAGEWLAACRELPHAPSADAARKWFESRFVPFEIVSAGRDGALFTGYYEPQLHVSRERT
ncbi:MAG: MltA domain-containing protein, partial [Alphaproteobacteria bacterium]|nr:MltA domain-containing protein [Alphaproteobacteria bacterium]